MTDDANRRILAGRELLAALIVEPELIERAQALGVTAAHFDAGYGHGRSWTIIGKCWAWARDHCMDYLDRRDLDDAGLAEDIGHGSKIDRQAAVGVVERCAPELVGLGVYVKEPAAPAPEIKSTTKPEPKRRRNKQAAGERCPKRRLNSDRKTDLTTIYFNTDARKRFKRSEDFLADLRKQFGDRDPLDCGQAPEEEMAPAPRPDAGNEDGCRGRVHQIPRRARLDEP
jgi:hypothetical protein